jgi:hypothetical protein
VRSPRPRPPHRWPVSPTTADTLASPGGSTPGPRPPWWPNGPGTPSKSCTGHTCTARVATTSDGSPGWSKLLASKRRGRCCSAGSADRGAELGRCSLIHSAYIPGTMTERGIRQHTAACDRTVTETKSAGQRVSACFGRRPRQDSNLRTRLRRPLLYPLSYGGFRAEKRVSARNQALDQPAHGRPRGRTWPSGARVGRVGAGSPWDALASRRGRGSGTRARGGRR